MCIDFFKTLFTQKSHGDWIAPLTPQPAPPVVVQPAIPPSVPIVFAHPEEPMNTTQTAANTSPSSLKIRWMTNYNVPSDYTSFWDTAIDIQVYDSWATATEWMRGTNINTPAFEWNDSTGHHIALLAKAANPGVVGYEEAHVSFALLSEEQKTTYKTTFDSLEDTDPLLIALFKAYPYELTSDTNTDQRISGHAEIYRILGETMPEALKQFYPRLF